MHDLTSWTVRWIALVAGIFPAAVLGLKPVQQDLRGNGTKRKTKQRTVWAATWNTHGACYHKCPNPGSEISCDKEYPRCRDGVHKQVSEFLASDAYDFIGLQWVTDRSLFTSSPDRWSHLEQPCGGVGYDVFPFDVVRLIYNSQRWEAVGEKSGGCLMTVDEHNHNMSAPADDPENNYRAFLVQAFRRKGTEDRITVFTAHFPHHFVANFKRKMDVLKEAITKVSVQSKAPRTLLVADTNFGAPTTSAEVVEHISFERGDVTSTDIAHDTCCWQERHSGSFDRIIAMNFDKASMVTELPFGDLHVPFGALTMHDPVVGKLTYVTYEVEVSSAVCAARTAAMFAMLAWLCLAPL